MVYGLHCILFDESACERLILQSIDADVKIRGFTAQINIKLHYKNFSDKPYEVAYTAPVDDNAAFYSFEADIDGRTITAHCMEKKKAEKLYKEAKERGHTAMIATENKDVGDLLHLLLGNFPPGSSAIIKIGMVMELKVQTDGGVHFVLPTVFNPRYAPDGTSTAPTLNMDSNAVTVSSSNQYSINIICEVDGGKPIARIISHTDPINVRLMEEETKAQVSQDGGYKADHDWSVVVYYSHAYDAHVLVETGDRSETALMKEDVMMINLFPDVPETFLSHRNEVIFIIDRSGSMGGSKIQSAKATLLLFLKSLPQGCMFNIVSFGSGHELLFKNGSVEYTEDSLKTALDLHKTLDANMGGTEILRPLKAVYSKPCLAGFSRQIMLITDGQVWNVNEVLDLLSRHAHESRLFSVGIGHGASTALVKGAAKAGRGRWELVIQEDQLQTKVMGLMANMLQDSVHNVTVECNISPPSRVSLIPRVPPVIFGGQHLLLYARLPPKSVITKVIVRGKIGDNDVKYEVSGDDAIKVIHDEAQTLHRLAAKAQIKQLQLEQEEDVQERVVNISTCSGVVSRYTAFVGIDSEGKCIEETPQESLSESEEDCQMYLSAPSFGQTCSMVPMCSSGTKFSGERRRAKSLQQNCKSLSRMAPAFLRKKTYQSESSCDENELLSDDDAIPKSNIGLFDLTTCFLSNQQFDGSWLEKDVLLLLQSQVPEATTLFSKKTYPAVACATAVALAILEKYFLDKKQEWFIIAEKAKQYLGRKGCNVDAIFTEACEWLTQQAQG